jgi:hypothetical protein
VGFPPWTLNIFVYFSFIKHFFSSKPRVLRCIPFNNYMMSPLSSAYSVVFSVDVKYILHVTVSCYKALL